MTPFVQGKNGIPGGVNMFVAYQGFAEMGFPCRVFEDMDGLGRASREDVVVGGMGTVRSRLEELGVLPEPIDYPETLTTYLGRKTWTTTFGEVRAGLGRKPTFVKPVKGKLFTGAVVSSASDLVRLHIATPDDVLVLCSEPVRFVQEWRCFVMRGEILDVRPYGDGWRAQFDPEVVEGAVAAYRDAPAGYAADFGVTEDGRTLLVEVNDGYALGSYGLQRNLYAQLLSARWAELVGTEDECRVR